VRSRSTVKSTETHHCRPTLLSINHTHTHSHTQTCCDNFTTLQSTKLNLTRGDTSSVIIGLQYKYNAIPFTVCNTIRKDLSRNNVWVNKSKILTRILETTACVTDSRNVALRLSFSYSVRCYHMLPASLIPFIEHRARDPQWIS